MSSEATDPDFTDAIAHAERRRAKLERLSDIGMELAEQIGAHTSASMAAVTEEKKGDPTRAFATVSRTVRLTLAMEARTDAQILALRKGKLPAGWGMAVFSPAASVSVARVSPHPPETVRSAVAAVIEREAADPADAEQLLRRLDQRLIERNEFSAFLGRPFDECVEVICEKLGIEPDCEDEAAFDRRTGLSTSPATVGRSPTISAGQRACACFVDEAPYLIRSDNPEERSSPHPLE